MPPIYLGPELLFPSPHLAGENGLLAVGGDLSSQRLLLAYSRGIFPWYSDNEPILWWAPKTRCVLLPGDFYFARSLHKLWRRADYRVTIDRAFESVVEACATTGVRRIEGTWITTEMMAAYGELYSLGFGHSVEVWSGEELVGGLYGVCLGRCFFGESMFHLRTGASKLALYALNQTLFSNDFRMIDMQMPTPHLLSLGGRLLPRQEFELLLRDAIEAGEPRCRPFPCDVEGV